MTTVAIIFLLLTVVGLTSSALLAFWWAGSSGQFDQLEGGAMTVFDADELQAGGEIQPESHHGDPHL